MQVWAVWDPLLRLGFYCIFQNPENLLLANSQASGVNDSAPAAVVTLAAGEGAVTALVEHAARHWTQLHSLRLRHTRLGDAELMVLQQRVAQEWTGVAEAMRF